jgi:anti-sigma regulatory factor (Ser/Thr protein kinase)
MARPPEEHRISLRVDARALGMLDDALRRYCADAALGPAQQGRLRLVLEELVTNTLSYGGCEGSLVEIGLRRAPTTLVVDYRDRGVPFDPATDAPGGAVEGSAEEALVGGLGWTLIRGLCRGLRYQRASGCNRIRLELPLGD